MSLPQLTLSLQFGALPDAADRAKMVRDVLRNLGQPVVAAAAVVA